MQYPKETRTIMFITFWLLISLVITTIMMFTTTRKAEAWTSTLPETTTCFGELPHHFFIPEYTSTHHWSAAEGGRLLDCRPEDDKSTYYSIAEAGKTFYFGTDETGHYFIPEEGATATKQVFENNTFGQLSVETITEKQYAVEAFNTVACNDLKYYTTTYTGQVLECMTPDEAIPPPPSTDPQDITPRDAKLIATGVILFLSWKFVKLFRYKL